MRIYFFTAPLAYRDFPGESKSRLYKFSLSLCHKKTFYYKNHHFQHVIRLIVEGNQKGAWFRISPWGVLPFDCLRKKGSGFCRFYGQGGGGAPHFVILSEEKRRMLENG